MIVGRFELLTAKDGKDARDVKDVKENLELPQEGAGFAKGYALPRAGKLRQGFRLR